MPSRQTLQPHHHHQNGSISPPTPSPSSPSQPPSQLTQHDLNFSVIKRQLPALESIIAKVSHTTIYSYSNTLNTWEKANIEGCLFLLQLSPLPPLTTPRYALFLLNRRYLSTWAITLTNPAGIDLTTPIIQLRGQATLTDAADGTFGTSSSTAATQSEGEEGRIWGVWVYEDSGGSTRDERLVLDAAIMECFAGVQP